MVMYKCTCTIIQYSNLLFLKCTRFIINFFTIMNLLVELNECLFSVKKVDDSDVKLSEQALHLLKVKYISVLI